MLSPDFPDRFAQKAYSALLMAFLFSGENDGGRRGR
jgi:hypothetical protein